MLHPSHEIKIIVILQKSHIVMIKLCLIGNLVAYDLRINLNAYYWNK